MNTGLLTIDGMRKWLAELIEDEKAEFEETYAQFLAADSFENKIVHYTAMVQQLTRIRSYEKMQRVLYIEPRVVLNNMEIRYNSLVAYHKLFQQHVKVVS